MCAVRTHTRTRMHITPDLIAARWHGSVGMTLCLQGEEPTTTVEYRIITNAVRRDPPAGGSTGDVDTGYVRTRNASDTLDFVAGTISTRIAVRIAASSV